MPEKFLVSWLCSKVLQKTDGSKIQCDELFSSYQKACEKVNITPLKDSDVARVVYTLFENVKKRRLSLTENEKKNHFVGITWKCTRDVTKVTVSNISDHLQRLPFSVMVLSRSVSSITLLMPSDLIVNGNIIMNEIKLDFESNRWSICIRGKELNLDLLHVWSHFEGTVENLTENLTNHIKVEDM